MIRIAEKRDIADVGKSYVELLTHEQRYGGYSNWVLDVYPTRETAEKSYSGRAWDMAEGWCSMPSTEP